MSSKGGSIFLAFSLIAALGAVGYATWANWQLQSSVLSVAENQERNLKEMMISLAHTEGQLGRVKEPVAAFDLERWLATVEGPLVDSLEKKVGAVQREVVREEVKKWAEQIEREQTKRWQAMSQSIAQVRKEIAKQTEAANKFDDSLTLLGRNQEELSKERQEGIKAQFQGLIQQGSEIKEQLSRVDGSTGELRAKFEEVGEQSQSLGEFLEQSRAADVEFQSQLQESLQLLAEAVEKQQSVTQEQMDQAAKHWQGLFLTLRENHDAELQGYREVVDRLEQERARALERLKQVDAQARQDAKRRVEKSREGRSQPMDELMEFCARRPESVLCRDVDLR